jgi:hypothetical protein
MRPLPIKHPTTRIAAQFIAIKTNPAMMGDDNETADSSFPVWACKLRNPNPSPSRMLNTGPAKQAVMAIFANPNKSKK